MLETKTRLGDLLDAKVRTPVYAASLETEGELYWFDFTPLDDDDLRLAVTGLGPAGEPLPWRLFTARQAREQLAHLAPADSRVLSLGRELPEPEPPAEPAPLAARGDEAKAPEAPAPRPDDLQTEQEVKIGADPAVLRAIGGFFNPPGLDKCAPDFRGTIEAIEWPLPDRRIVPRMVVKYTCVAGNILLSETHFPMSDDPESPRRITICSSQFHFENTRTVAYEQVQKSTKLSVGLGLGFTAGGGLHLTAAKEGEPVFGAGEAKLDAQTGKQLRFDFGLARTHAKLKIQAFERLVLDVPEMACRELGVPSEL
jgi:hypothetical protein